jgi:plastocyanin
MVPGQSGPSYCPVVGRGYWSSYVMAPLGAWKRPGRGRFLRNIPTAVSRAISRSRPPMRSIRLLAAGLTILAVAACATSTPGWTYAPAPSATPIPSAGASASAGPSGSAAPSASAAPSSPASAAPSASAAASQSAPPSASAPTAVVELAAQNIAFTPTELSVAADVAFQINFANNDAGVPHNVEIKDAGGVSIFKGDIFNGVETRTYAVEPLTAGTYQFVCSVHSNMTGTLTAQ